MTLERRECTESRVPRGSPAEAWVRNANIFRNGEVQKGCRPPDPETAQTPLDPRIWGRNQEANFKEKAFRREDKRRQNQGATLNHHDLSFLACLGENAARGAVGKKGRYTGSPSRKVIEQAGSHV